jgi:hypothetical protein
MHAHFHPHQSLLRYLLVAALALAVLLSPHRAHAFAGEAAVDAIATAAVVGYGIDLATSQDDDGDD